MNRIIVVLLIVGFMSCQSSEKEVGKLDMAKQYYKVLDNSDESGIVSLLSDSIVIRENEDDYEEVFSKKEYVEWLRWDSVFDPTYTILDIENKDGVVKAKLSKIDKRILFLHEEPMVWNELVRFDKNKIVKVERIKYDVFNVDKFLKNRGGFLKWIDENRPELNGIINDQTKPGGVEYLNAIELYKNNK